MAQDRGTTRMHFLLNDVVFNLSDGNFSLPPADTNSARLKINDVTHLGAELFSANPNLAHEDPARRYAASAAAGLFYVLLGLGWMGPLYEGVFAGWMTPRFGAQVSSLAFALAFVQRRAAHGEQAGKGGGDGKRKCARNGMLHGVLVRQAGETQSLAQGSGPGA